MPASGEERRPARRSDDDETPEAGPASSQVVVRPPPGRLPPPARLPATDRGNAGARPSSPRPSSPRPSSPRAGPPPPPAAAAATPGSGEAPGPADENADAPVAGAGTAAAGLGAPPEPRADPPSIEIALETDGEVGDAARDDARLTGSIPPPLALERGPIARFGRFDILGRIAVGGMADLLLARETAEGGASRHAVLKLIRGEFSEDGAFAKMFLDEGRLAMRLSHPAICTVYEVGRESGRFFMAMEFVEGQTLQKVIGRSVSHQELLPLGFLLRLFAQVAEALDFAHNVRDAKGRRLHIVHRDVSPNNIMVRYDGVVKLLDFGVAKAERNQSATVSGAVKGKFSYMSPEQAMSEPVDPRSDIFSLGVCLFEAATGRRLYRRKAQYDVLKAILDEPAPSVLSVRPDLPERLDEIILKALEKDPSDRYQTAADLQHDLEELLAEQRLVVNTRAMAQQMRALFAEEMAAGPELDTGHAVVERFEALHTHPPATPSQPPASSGRLGWIAAGVAGAAALGLAAWVALGPDAGPAAGSAVPAATAPPVAAPPVAAPSLADPSLADPVSPDDGADPVPVAVVADETATNGGADSVDSTATGPGSDEAGPDDAPPAGGTEAESPSTATDSGSTGRRRRRGRSSRRSRGGGSVIVTDPGFGP